LEILDPRAPVAALDAVPVPITIDMTDTP